MQGNPITILDYPNELDRSFGLFTYHGEQRILCLIHGRTNEPTIFAQHISDGMDKGGFWLDGSELDADESFDAFQEIRSNRWNAFVKRLADAKTIGRNKNNAGRYTQRTLHRCPNNRSISKWTS